MASFYQNKNMSVRSKLIPSVLKKTLLGLKNKRKSFSLIDLGCGCGDFLYLLKKAGCLKGVKVFGLDIDKKALLRLKERLPEAKTIFSNGTNLKTLRRGSFDFAICTQVVEHVEDDKIWISEINRILKKDGILYITSVLKKRYGLYWYRNKFGRIVLDPGHLREYASPNEFKNLLTKRGFYIKNLTVYRSVFPLGSYFLQFLAKVGILKFTNLRDYYLNHPKICQLASKMEFLPIPGYAPIEVIAEKK